MTANQYVWSIAYVNSPVERDDNSASGSYGKSGSGLGRRIYVQEDVNYNITALTNTSGVVQQRFDYTPYGVMTVLDGATSWGTTTNLLSWVYTFQGGRYGSTSGMIHFSAREYSPRLARWVQEDSPCLDGLDLFQAFDSNPLSFIDPNGTSADTRPTTGPTNPCPDSSGDEEMRNLISDLRSLDWKRRRDAKAKLHDAFNRDKTLVHKAHTLTNDPVTNDLIDDAAKGPSDGELGKQLVDLRKDVDGLSAVRNNLDSHGLTQGQIDLVRPQIDDAIALDNADIENLIGQLKAHGAYIPERKDDYGGRESIRKYSVVVPPQGPPRIR